jgi:parallel beta-helix repeat protein
MMLILSSLIVLTSESASASSPIIRIKADGSVEGTSSIQRNGDNYVLTSNLQSSVGKNEAFIFIERDNIKFDGAGYSLQGAGFGTAIYMLRRQNVTVTHFNILGFETGINFWTVQNWPDDSKFMGLPSASKNNITSNNIMTVGTAFDASSKEAGWCIYLGDAIGNNILSNTITSVDHRGGIFLDPTSAQTNLMGNQFVGCGIYATESNQTFGKGNTVDGKPLALLNGESNKVVEGAGLVYLLNCNNIVVKNIQPTYDYGQTILLVGTQNSEILSCRGYVTLRNSSKNSIHDNSLSAIELYSSCHNRIFANSISFSGICIKLAKSSNYNELYWNALTYTSKSSKAEKIRQSGMNTAGIQLGDLELGGSQFNNIHDNYISNNDVGIECFLSSNNTITANEISDCKAGIQLGSTTNQNNITRNNVTSCTYGVSIYAAPSKNNFYHNNFVNNNLQCLETHRATLLASVDSYSFGNTWDNGKEGNFWGDYTGLDGNGDGVGDTAYNVFENMTDHYPLMKPFVTSSLFTNESEAVPMDQNPTVAHPTVPPTPTTGTQEPFPLTYTLVAVGIVIGFCVVIGAYLKKRMF